MSADVSENSLHASLVEMQRDIPSRSNESRLKRDQLRIFMDKKGLEALYIRHKDSFAWLTAGANNGGVLSTENGAAGILLTADSQYVVASNIETPRLIQEEYLDQLGFEIVSTSWMKKSDYDVALSLVDSKKIYSDISLDRFINVHSDFLSQRYTLTENEIERYTTLGHLTSLVIEQTMMMDIHPGLSELEIIAILSKNLWAVGIEPVNMLCAVDERIDRYRHPAPTEKPLEKLCMVSIGARYSGLIVSLTRTLSFGPQSSNLKEKKVACDTIFEEMVKHTYCGNSVAEILEIGMKTYEEVGYPEEYFNHHQGGAIGYLPREYKVTPTSKESVQKNQGFCWNPTIQGIKAEDTIVTKELYPVAITRPILFPYKEIRCGDSVVYISGILEQ